VIRLLPFILIPILIVAGLGYWRFTTSKSSLTAPQTNQTQADLGPVEVPKSLPNATLDDRVEDLEEVITKLVPQVNGLKSASSPAPASSSLESRLTNLESAVTELKVRVSALEKATPAPAVSSGKSTVYIPLGAGGSWSDVDWNSLVEYEISLNPDNYPGYTGMYLEANFRMNESVGTASVRLYNVTDSSATSSQLDTTSTAFSLKTSSSFKLASGTKTYRLQVKSTERKDVFIQSARIRVNF